MSEVASNEGEIAKLQNQYSNYNIRSGMYYITAPQTGQVTKAKKAGIGEIVKDGEMIIEIIPDEIQYAVEIFVGLFIMGRYGVQRMAFYIIPGIAMWYFMFQSGVHATISGVLLAFAIPFGKGGDDSLSYKLQHFLHKPVAYFIVPLFALANTGIRLQPGFYNEFFSKNSLGIIAGLVIGKPIGILLFAWIAVKTKLSELPGMLNWKYITGAGLLAGIGFTMSIFITLLAFDDNELVINSKIAILCASLIAAIAGLILIKNIKDPLTSEEDDHTLP